MLHNYFLTMFETEKYLKQDRKTFRISCFVSDILQIAGKSLSRSSIRIWKACWYCRTLYSTKKRQHFLHTESIFSSDNRQSMKRRIATERLSKIYIVRCGYIWLDESKLPQEWPISSITIVYLKIPSEKMKSFCLHKIGFKS